MSRRKQGEEARVTLKSLVGKVVKKPMLPKPAEEKDNKTLNANYIDPMLTQLKETDVRIPSRIDNNWYCVSYLQ